MYKVQPPRLCSSWGVSDSVAIAMRCLCPFRVFCRRHLQALTLLQLSISHANGCEPPKYRASVGIQHTLPIFALGIFPSHRRFLVVSWYLGDVVEFTNHLEISFESNRWGVDRYRIWLDGSNYGETWTRGKSKARGKTLSTISSPSTRLNLEYIGHW